MYSNLVGGYRTARKGVIALALGATVTLGGVLGAFAQDAGTFDGGGQVKGGGYAEYEYAASPYEVTYDDTVYIYGTGKDGKGSYVTYDGSEWSDYYTWEDQPADYAWDPAAVVYNDANNVFYGSKDGGLYHNGYSGGEWSGWENLAGDYSFTYAPYTNVYDDTLYLYGVADDSYVYYKTYDGVEWSAWEPANDDYLSGVYQPYAVEWGGYENVFWTGDDGKVYWNRYDDAGWTGAKELPYADATYEYGSAPYAIGYSADEKLYAYAITTDGAPNWNVFTEGEGWSGWKAYEAEVPVKAKGQPHAYEYDGVQHLIVSGEDGHAYYTTYDGSYGEWADLGDNYAYDPYTYEYDDAYYLTYTGENGYLYYKEYKAGDSGY
ncbi:MAG: hypothetical protein H0T91_06870 [Propionibacteriaceae bacterium]|nr:hypothetical protein [Propionibacteriaceae bacterium]